MFDFLKKIPLFSELSRSDLKKLCGMAEEVRLKAGDMLFAEGSKGDFAYVIRQGRIEIRKASGNGELLLAVRGEGEVIGEMAPLEQATRMASAWAATDCRLISIHSGQLDRLLQTSPSAARSMLHTVSTRLRSTEALLRQNERMAQLGTFTAGIAHELNNPAAAALRASQQLQAVLSGLEETLGAVARTNLTEVQRGEIDRLLSDAKKRASTPAGATPGGEQLPAGASGPAGAETGGKTLELIDGVDREDLVYRWLEERGLRDEDRYVPELAAMGYDPAELGRLEASFPPHALPLVVEAAALTFSAHSLMHEISLGAERVAAIVKALKNYSYLGQESVQSADVHEGIENTLVILRNKLKGGVSVRREYGSDLSRVLVHGGELNQVWTNIIDNAVEAMGGRGELVIRTSEERDRIVVEFEDTGPGIPENLQPLVFTPFFTTKPVGKGTGLGLNISYGIVQKHGGSIGFTSRPGRTVFTVRIPVDRP